DRRSMHYTLAHFFFVGEIEGVFPETAHRARQRVKALSPISRFKPGVIVASPKLDIGVEGNARLRPVERQMEAELGGQHIRDEERLRIEPVRWERSELALPQLHDAT